MPKQSVSSQGIFWFSGPMDFFVARVSWPSFMAQLLLKDHFLDLQPSVYYLTPLVQSQDELKATLFSYSFINRPFSTKQTADVMGYRQLRSGLK